jgi:hypothetical protein
MKIEELGYKGILNDVVSIIEGTRNQIAIQENSSLTIMFWRVGERIKREILQNKRAEYGKKIVVTLSRELVNKYGNNFEEKNLRRMIQFAENSQTLKKSLHCHDIYLGLIF